MNVDRELSKILFGTKGQQDKTQRTHWPCRFRAAPARHVPYHRLALMARPDVPPPPPPKPCAAGDHRVPEEGAVHCGTITASTQTQGKMMTALQQLMFKGGGADELYTREEVELPKIGAH